MKIGFTGLALPEGKVKYKDEIIQLLEEKHKPDKVTPFFAEFIKDDFEKGEANVLAKDNILDLLILDIEKFENRMERAESQAEKDTLRKCLDFMEEEKPLCDMELSDEEKSIITPLDPLSLRATLTFDETPDDIDKLMRTCIDKAGYTFFYTAGKKEVRSWFIHKGSDAVTCAGKIHSDLARGFIKADIVNISDYKDCHNLQDARSKGFVKLVDKDYVVQEGDIIEIRFNV